MKGPVLRFESILILLCPDRDLCGNHSYGIEIIALAIDKVC